MMASKTRGHKLKSEVAGDGFLNVIPTANIVPTKYEPLYYHVLDGLGYRDLAYDRAIVAWMIAYTTVRIYQAIDQSAVANDADRTGKIAEMESLPKLQKSLLDLLNAFHGKRREEPQDNDDLQEQLARALNGSIGDRTTD